MAYNIFSSVIIRSPASSFDFLRAYLEGEQAILFEKDRNMQDAIYIASPTLHSELQKENPDKLTKNTRLTSSLERYISRMATRCTPFGLFAGCSVGVIEEKTQLENADIFNRTTRLDMYYLCTLYDALVKLPAIKKTIYYYPNTSIYAIGDKYRYIESKYVNTRRIYQIAEVEQSIYLNTVLSNAHKGCNLETMCQSLINENITREEALSYINEIIDSQLLVGELYQAVTGDDFFTRFVELIAKTDCDQQLLSTLQNIQRLVQQMDISQDTIPLYKQLIEQIKQLNIPYEEKFLFQVDMVKNMTHASVGKEVVDELKSTMVFLNKVSISGRKETFHQFQEAFYSRYEDMEVPLMEALDPEHGIGYPPQKGSADISVLVDDVYLPFQASPVRTSTTTPFQSLLLNKTIQVLSRQETEIVLTDKDIDELKLSARWDDLPPTFYTMFKIIRSKPDDQLIQLSFFSGTSGANLLGRFAHTDEKIAQLVHEIARKEEELMPDVILAEIAHLPEARIGNVQSRPHIRKYEIVFMAYTDLPEEQVILVSDLMLSVRNGQLMIRSKKLNKQVVPRLTTAHNFQNNTLPVYRFLCDMQHPAGRSGLLFIWPSELEGQLPYRPRVRYKQTILSPAAWIAKKEEISPFFSLAEDTKLLAQVKAWIKVRAMPRYMLMPDGDNDLFVDWESALSIRSLFSIIKNRPQVTFTEFLFEPENAVVKDRHGEVYTNECIVAFYKDNTK